MLSDDGTTIRARKAYENAEFLASTDERFRPVYITNAPDGALYVVDMYRGVIQDRMSTTMYLRDHILSRKLDAPVGLGRIYRVVHETTKRDTMNPFANATPAQLVEALSHANGWRRDTAQRLLVERNAKSVVPALVKLAENTQRSAREAARPVDARRPRCHRTGDGCEGARGPVFRRADVGDPNCRALARDAEPPDCDGRARAHRGYPLVGSRAACRVARGAAAGTA